MTATLIAYDGSGSTRGANFYHDEVQRIVATLPADSTILFWDSRSKIITHKELAQINALRKGGNETDPSLIAQHVQRTGFNGNLVIITDGQVGSVTETERYLNSDTKFASVTVYIIHTGGAVNMSMGCAFTRRSPHQIVLYNERHQRQLVTTVTTEELGVISKLATISTVAEFQEAAPALEKAVVAATMGSMGDPSLRDALLAIKSRIQREEARIKGESATVIALEKALDDNRDDDAISLARLLTAEYYGESVAEDPDAVTWSARISRFVSMTEGALRSTFDLSGISAAIRGDRARRAAAATSAPAAAVSLTSEQPDAGTPLFPCPITCDDEADVVLLVSEGDGDGTPLLAGLNKEIANSLYDCPLNLLNHPELIQALKERLDHVISLRSLKDSYAAGHPMTTSPITRRSVMGAICLGTSEEHSQATTWTLAHLFTGGKLIGNPDFWFACIWLLVERGTIPYLTPALPQLRAHMQWRLANHKTAVSLTGLPEYPATRVSLRTAIWYVFASPEIGLGARRDLLRAHLPHLHALNELLTLAGYEMKPVVKRHVTRLRVMLSMLSWVKRDHGNSELSNRILALVQQCIEVDPTAVRMSFEATPRFIPVDGAPTPEQVEGVLDNMPALYRKLTVAELVGLAALVSPSKSAGDIELPLTWTPPAPPAAITDGWPLYGLQSITPAYVRICPATCRPFYRPTADTTWVTEHTAHYGHAPDAPRILSANEAFGNFVVKYGVYPTRDEMLTYVFNRRILHGENKTLPHQTTEFIEQMFTETSALMGAITPETFAARFMASRDIKKRQELESALTEPSDPPIASTQTCRLGAGA